MDLLAEKLRTLLQTEMHLERTCEAAFGSGAKPVPVKIVDGVLSRASGARIKWKFTTQRRYVSDLVLRT